MRTPASGRRLSVALSMILLWGILGRAEPQTPPSIAGQDPAPFKIAVNVDLVVLQPTVRDHKGRFVSDLREQDFQVYEDGVRQSIRLFKHEDVPVTVGLVIDHSGSMWTKLNEVIAAARTFVRSSNREDEMFVVNFNEHVTLGLPPEERFSNRADELQAAILKVQATGETALYDAVAEALDLVHAGAREKKVLIVISDGGDNASIHSLAEVLKMAELSNTLVYTVGIFTPQDADQNPGVLRRFAQATGGEAFLPEELDDVVPICERIAHDIRNQYTIGYFSSNAVQPGVFRTIRVVATGTADRKLSVRARSGYIAGGGQAPVKLESAK